MPKKYDVDQAIKHYIDFSFMYIKVGKQTQFKALLKKLVELYTENGVDLNLTTYYGGFGTEQPMYLVTQIGKSRLDFWTKYYTAMKKLNADNSEQNLWDSMLKTMRDVEYNCGYYRPDLSYVPSKE